MRVEWLDAALDNLDQAVEYIAQDNPVAATEVAQKIRDATKLLAEQPGIGRPGRVEGTRELVITGLPYIVPYVVRGDRVIVLRVMHAAMMWPEQL